MDAPDRIVIALASDQPDQLDIRVACEQPDEFATDVPRRPDDPDPDATRTTAGVDAARRSRDEVRLVAGRDRSRCGHGRITIQVGCIVMQSRSCVAHRDALMLDFGPSGSDLLSLCLWTASGAEGGLARLCPA
jgi:hypothetical protein